MRPNPASSLASSHVPIQVAQERLRAKIYEQVNVSDMLLYQLQQRGRAWDELQRRLQQLQDAQMEDKRLQEQVIRQLENNIDKMLTKVRACQRVTTLYLAVRDVLRKVSSSSLCHCPTHSPRKGNEVPQELSDSQRSIPALATASPFSDVLQEEMTQMETRFRAERELRFRSLAAQNVPIDRLWLKEASEKHLRAVSGGVPGQAGLRAEGRHRCQTPPGVGGLQGQLPQGVTSSRGDDEHPCSKPATSSPWTSRTCTCRTRRRVSAWQGAGGWDTGTATDILPCRFPPTLDTKQMATKTQMEREAWVTEKMEKAKAAVQCSRLWVM
uniref:Uncharacterized protein n=1 Tax=Calidris pygmaea TaxID=425635 RepID=A0A8C3PK89_9CHAR